MMILRNKHCLGIQCTKIRKVQNNMNTQRFCSTAQNITSIFSGLEVLGKTLELCFS